MFKKDTKITSMLLAIVSLLSVFYFIVSFLLVVINKTGNKTRLVIIATNNVREVSQPSACVPPKSDKQKIMKPATNTSEV